MGMVNKMTKELLLKYGEKGLRLDGRQLNEFRTITVKTGIVNSAEGSARVKIGETEVIAGVKLSIETPYPDTPDQGNLMVNAELLPLSSPLFEAGPPGDQAVELARVVDRGIRESKTINNKKLCITAGEKVWSVMIDVCIINDAGNLIDASSLAAIAALKNAIFPGITKEGKADYELKTKEPLPIQRTPIEVTVFKIGNLFIVDPTSEEEPEADARLTVAIAENGNLYALQKGGSTPLTIEELNKMVSIAVEQSTLLRSAL